MRGNFMTSLEIRHGKVDFEGDDDEKNAKMD
jgi:hypothetical protein